MWGRKCQRFLYFAVNFAMNVYLPPQNCLNILKKYHTDCVWRHSLVMFGII